MNPKKSIADYVVEAGVFAAAVFPVYAGYRALTEQDTSLLNAITQGETYATAITLGTLYSLNCLFKK